MGEEQVAVAFVLFTCSVLKIVNFNTSSIPYIFFILGDNILPKVKESIVVLNVQIKGPS